MADTTNWAHEKRYARKAGATCVKMEMDGTETTPFPLLEVLDRKWYFPYPGVYILRDGNGVVQFVGVTSRPLHGRLKAALVSRQKWTRQDFSKWSVAMAAKGCGILEGVSWEADTALANELIERYAPRFNQRQSRIVERALAGAKELAAVSEDTNNEISSGR